MKTAIECIYKGIKEIKEGSFKNAEGNIINYKGFYKIVFDQIISNYPKETELKINKDIALNIAKNFKPYDRIILNIDFIIYSNTKVIVRIISVEKQ